MNNISAIKKSKILLENVCKEYKDRKGIMQGIAGENNHALDVLNWVEKLNPKASIALKLAALFHDIDRVVTPEVGGGFKGDRNSKEYLQHKKNHARRSAEFIIPLLKKNKVVSGVILKKTLFLIIHHDDTGEEVAKINDIELNYLVSADSFAFFTSIAPKLFKAEGIERIKDKIRFMVDKLPDFARQLLRQQQLKNKIFNDLKNEIIEEYYTLNKIIQNILIIGANGMLGQELVRIFRRDKDYNVTAWDKEELDITNQSQVNKKMSELKPNIVINSAAYNAVDKAEEKKEFEAAKNINGLAPGYLAKAAKKNNAIFVHYSSDYVFDGNLEKILEPAGCTHICTTCSLHDNFTPQFGYNESAVPNPISNYGKSKLLGERTVARNAKKYYIIRLSKLFGKPAKTEGAKRSFFDIMLELGRNNRKIRVIDEETSCFTYAPDLAKKTKEIIESKKPFGIYHVTNTDPCTWYEAVVELYHQAKIRAKVVPVSSDEFPRPARRPYVSTLINTKLNPLRSYKEALKDYLRNSRIKN